ncbi:MAG TPA: class I SAM-dependent methyltransferase [Chitinophagaceae bacterium]|nr:class I SAM-dependent methyltransferase [Chitinophagaceae bacterium]
MKEFWNTRYGDEAYAYGELPNLYFKEKITDLKPGKILLPAEGEGRNAVYAALKGWKVTCFDISEKGRQKAEQLAQKNGVQINYLIRSVDDVVFKDREFDAIALIFAHFPIGARQIYHERFSNYLKPQGHIILEAFSKKQLQFQKTNANAGGPREENMLYDTTMLISDFPDYDLLELYQTDLELNEGLYHVGPASVVRFFGQKE